MIDFHSHILPGFDDGAEDIEMSVKMLEKSKADGIDTIISTSHAYIKSQDSINVFLNRRKKYKGILNDGISGPDLPEVKYGAEVHLYTDLSQFEHIDKLTIEGTNYILIEMPSRNWNDNLFEYVYNLTISGFRPIIAHIDRYMWAKDKFSNLACLDAVFQVNSDFFMSKKRLKDALWLFEKGYCHILGSDMHNLTERPTHMAEAYAVIEKKFGKAYTEYLDKNGRDILNNKRIHKTVHLPKVSKFSLLF